MNHLKDLHDNYVITRNDKATGIVAFIYKRFYPVLQAKELGIDEDKSSNKNTYVSVTNSKTNIVNKLIASNNRELPHLYWLPRFIVAATRCSVKPSSKAVISALKLLYQQIKPYNENIILQELSFSSQYKVTLK